MDFFITQVPDTEPRTSNFNIWHLMLIFIHQTIELTLVLKWFQYFENEYLITLVWHPNYYHRPLHIKKSVIYQLLVLKLTLYSMIKINDPNRYYAIRHTSRTLWFNLRINRNHISFKHFRMWKCNIMFKVYANLFHLPGSLHGKWTGLDPRGKYIE